MVAFQSCSFFWPTLYYMILHYIIYVQNKIIKVAEIHLSWTLKSISLLKIFKILSKVENFSTFTFPLPFKTTEGHDDKGRHERYSSTGKLLRSIQKNFTQRGKGSRKVSFCDDKWTIFHSVRGEGVWNFDFSEWHTFWMAPWWQQCVGISP